MSTCKKIIRKFSGKRKSSKNCVNVISKRSFVTYVINCKWSEKRMKEFAKYAKTSGIKFCKENCVDGRKFTDSSICEMIDCGIVNSRADITPVETAICLSHYNVWERFLKSKKEYAIIFEDDVKLRSSTYDDIELILNNLGDLKNMSILWLYNGNWMETSKYLKTVVKINDKLIVQQETIAYNAAASAYIISRNFSEHLIKNIFPIEYPVDIYIGDQVKYGDHLTLKMTYDKKEACYVSPLMELECGGTEGSTQMYDAKQVSATECFKE